MSEKLHVIACNEQQYLFLVHVLESYSQRGLPAKNLQIAAELADCVFGAQVMEPKLDLGSAKLTEVGPNGLALEIATSQE